MYCFAKFCCFCLKLDKSKNFVSLKHMCKDNISLYDKITYCLLEEFQDIIKHKVGVGDARICVSCREQVGRTYRFFRRTKECLNIIKGYASTLSQTNCEKDVSILEVSLNTPTKKKTTEENDKTQEIFEIRFPLRNIIEHGLIGSENTDDCIDVKPIININNLLKLNQNEDCKIKLEPDDIEMQTEYLVKHEILNDSEDEESYFADDISIKEEFFLPGSPNDIKIFLEEEAINNEIFTLSDPIENETIPQEPVQKIEVPHTSQETEKRKKPTPLPCPLCKFIFYSANAMARHLSKLHNKSRISCNICNKSFKSKMVLKRHVAVHANEMYNCVI